MAVEPWDLKVESFLAGSYYAHRDENASTLPPKKESVLLKVINIQPETESQSGG